MPRDRRSPPPPPINATLPTAGEWWSALATDAWRRGQAAADPLEALRWLDRARRILPHDDTVGLNLAAAHLRAGNAAAAATLFAGIAERWDVLEAWMGLAASALRLGDAARAAAALQAALSRHAVPLAFHPLIARVAEAAGAPGWCAVDAAGALHADAPAETRQGGVAVPVRWRAGRCRLPPCARLDVSRGGRTLLGSPIDLAAMATCEGVVALTASGDLTGWAWHPRNPAQPPVVTVCGQAMTLRTPSDAVLNRPLARPRRLHVPAAVLAAARIEVTGPDDLPLLGSPLFPRSHLKKPSHSGRGLGEGYGQAKVSRTKQPTNPPKPTDVVVPVYRGAATTLACLRAALASLPAGSRLHVVDDASPEPALQAAVAALAAADSRINLITLPRNLGFPGAANAGLRAAAGRDVALLNSDAIVPPGWLQALTAALHSAPDIASACPLSNEATILSYPDPAGGNPLADPVAMTALASRANGAATVDIPVAVGFCMLLRRDALEAVGLFREDVFAQGYGEENDWCLRAGQRGWRHVAVPGCYVAHEGAASFGPARRHLMERNSALLERLHPGYHAMIEQWVGQDPLAPARRAIDALRWAAGHQASATAIVTHDSGGGVERLVATRAGFWREQGVRPVLIRPKDGAAVVGDGDTPNLRFRLPEEWPALLSLLRSDGVARVELHHTLGHPPDIVQLARRLGVPQDVFVHDYAWFCPRIALVPEHAYCGEPDVAGCERCVAQHGSLLSEPIRPAALVARSAALLAAAARVVVPSADVARRMRRHFPTTRPDVTSWEDDASIPPPPATGPVSHVLTVGGIGPEKGFEVLLACVQDVARRNLPLRFTVVGTTADDARLLAAGPVFVTGRYSDDEVVPLIQAQQADVALLPSVWPETWCFTLSHVWRAGLRATVFDLGTPAERVRATGWGHVLPLGLPAAALNDWLLRRSQPARPPHDRRQNPSPLSAYPAM